MIKNLINGKSVNDFFGSDFELIDSGFATGKENMRYDFERTKLVAEGKALPMFRLYGWDPWCVSLGANQKENNIDKKECADRNYSIVRRPTGGRAVLHADELTYSVVIRVEEGKKVHEIYRDIHVLLLDGLRKLGCEELGFEKSQPEFKDIYKDNVKSISCFASSARYEIEWNGKKLVGSAQRLFGNTLLQHGSILLDKGYEQIVNVAQIESEEKRDSLMDYTLKHSATLTEICKRKIEYREAVEAVITAFE